MKSYAVFISGHVSVNSTVQEPVWSVTDQFYVHVPSAFSLLPNKAPMVSGFIEEVSVMAGETSLISVGSPYDMQLDNFWVSKWGIIGTSDVPSWIQFQNTTIDDGIKFQFDPTEKDVDLQWEVFFTLQDANTNNPLSKRYKFALQVVGSNSLLQGDGDGDEELQQSEEIISVTVSEVSIIGEFNIIFGSAVHLLKNCTDWDAENEGSNRINIEMLTSNSTGIVLDEQDLTLTLAWHVVDVEIKDSDDRRLQAQNSLVEIQKMTIQLDFSDKALVSRD